jgi:hypothetical protein
MQFSAQVHFNDGIDVVGSRGLNIRRDFPSDRKVAAGDIGANTSTVDPTLYHADSPVVEVNEGETYRVHAFYQNATTGLYTTGFSTANYGTAFFSGEVIDPVATTPNDISAISGTFTQNLTALSTVNFSDLPTVSSTLNSGDLWVDLSDTFALRVTP